MTDDWCETGPAAPSTLEPFSALKLNRRRSVDSTAPTEGKTESISNKELF